MIHIYQILQESNRKEREIMSRQYDEDKVEQKKSEVRMNRWYNRLLNRHQDDPVSHVTKVTYNVYGWN